MSFLLRDISNEDSGTLSRRKYSKFNSINDTFSKERLITKKTLLKHERKKGYAGLEASALEIDDYNWSENLDARFLKGAYGQVLTTESESVMEYSILSNSSRKPLKDSEIQLFTPGVIGNNEPFSLEEVNAQLVLILDQYMEDKNSGTMFLSNVSICLIPQIVKIMQLMSRFHRQSSSKLDSKKFVQLIVRILEGVWLPNLRYSVGAIKSTMEFLEDYEEEYSVVETKQKSQNGDVEVICDAWLKLNYLPKVLINSLRFKVQSQVLTTHQCEVISKHELMKKVVVTMSLQMSKAFIKIMETILLLNAQDFFPNSGMIDIVEAFLECTIECRTGEIMIGIETLVERWIKVEPRHAPQYHRWSEQMLVKYNIQAKTRDPNKEMLEENQEDEQDLMFNKWEIGIFFLRSIFEYTAPREPLMCIDPETIGWLTVFNDDCVASEGESEGEIEPHSIASIAAPHMKMKAPPQTQMRQGRGGKRARIREWVHKKKVKISEKYHTFIETIEQTVHLRKSHIMITSLRCYNTISGTNSLAARNVFQLQRLTQKLYKKEQKGRRKRDAIKVIFGVA